ncbi:pentatricopeptide repeat-containing protein [Rosa sericea]
MDCIIIGMIPILSPQNFARNDRVAFMVRPSSTRRSSLPKNLRYPRQAKLPPDLGVNQFLNKTSNDASEPEFPEEEEEEYTEDGDIVWESDEIEAIQSLFQGRIPQKPGSLNRQRPLPLPLPYKVRPSRLPSPKKNAVKIGPMSKQVYKNPNALVGLAREIRSLASDKDVGIVLNKRVHFLRKGSLSMTIRELGHMGLPERALQTFCWAQKQPQLYPDDRILSSTVEVLARNHELKLPFNLDKFTSSASRGVIEAMVRGFIKGGSLHLAWKLVSVAKDNQRKLDPSLYAKLIVEFGKNPDKHMVVMTLLEELGEREDLNLSQQDCTAIMKVCIRLGKFEVVESVYDWFRQSGHDPTVVIYTTLIHSRYSEKRYREALAVVWEMEASNCLFDFPAYRVVIKLFVALNDLARAVRYFSKLKEAGFTPTYDVYRDLIRIYMVSGRLAKCREICKEVEMGGLKLDQETMSHLLQLEREKRFGI